MGVSAETRALREEAKRYYDEAEAREYTAFSVLTQNPLIEKLLARTERMDAAIRPFQAARPEGDHRR